MTSHINHVYALLFVAFGLVVAIVLVALEKAGKLGNKKENAHGVPAQMDFEGVQLFDVKDKKQSDMAKKKRVSFDDKVRHVGDRVNLECDVMAKYAEKLLAGQLDDRRQER